MREINLDMDGVLANFDKRRVEVFGQFAEVEEEQWKHIHRNYPKWFLELEPMPDMKVLLIAISTMVKASGLSVRVLTAIPKLKALQETVSQHKVAWCRKHLKDWGFNYKIVTCLGAEKQLYANRNAVLIDDSGRNIGQWINKGGMGILHSSAKETINCLNQLR